MTLAPRTLRSARPFVPRRRTVSPWSRARAPLAVLAALLGAATTILAEPTCAQDPSGQLENGNCLVTANPSGDANGAWAAVATGSAASPEGVAVSKDGPATGGFVAASLNGNASGIVALSANGNVVPFSGVGIVLGRGSAQCYAACVSVGGPAAGLVAASGQGPAEGLAAASATGAATTTDPVGVGSAAPRIAASGTGPARADGDSGVALGGTGSADGALLAASGTGGATCARSPCAAASSGAATCAAAPCVAVGAAPSCGSTATSAVVACIEPAWCDGNVCVNPHGNAACSTCIVTASPTGSATGGFIAASGTNSATEGFISASGTGSASAPGEIAVSGAGPASGPMAVSGTAPAYGNFTGVSGTGSASCDRRLVECAAASGTGPASGAQAASGKGDATAGSPACVGGLLFQNFGWCIGGVAVSGLGNSSATGSCASWGITICSPGVAASGTGHAYGPIAVSACNVDARACL